MRYQGDDLAKAVGTSSAIIGRYERNEITPSVEVAAKIADALDVSLDYLVGASSFVVKEISCSRVIFFTSAALKFSSTSASEISSDNISSFFSL